MDRIRELRRAKELSQARLAVRAGMDPATLNRIEQGKANPNLKTLEKLADALSVEVADLFAPKVNALPRQLSLNNAIEAEAGRRTIHLELLATYAIHITDKMKEEIDAGHVTPEWGHAIYRELTGLLMLFNTMLKVFPGHIPEEGIRISADEKKGLEKVSEVVDKSAEVLQKLGEALGPAIPKETREETQRALRLVRGGLAA